MTSVIIYGHKIAVIGSGPAGLSCAYYLAVLGHTVTVFEKDQKPGGMMVSGIPSFPSVSVPTRRDFPI